MCDLLADDYINWIGLRQHRTALINV